MSKNNIPKTHLFADTDLHLYEIQNIFTACALWLEQGMEKQIATYDLVVRDMPPHRNFLLLGGVEEVISGIQKWGYSEDEIAYLNKHHLATPKLIRYLRNFKFTGDVYAMPEGTVFFPGEPVVRITAPICEGNLLSNFLMTTVFGNSIYLSKIIRSKIVCQDKRLLISGAMRVTSYESAMKSSRAGYIVGGDTAFPAFFNKYNLTPPSVSINAYHAVIKSFPSEIEAFRAAASLFPNRLRPMVDTYDFKRGIANLITVANEIKIKGQHIASITIDSGDLAARARYARKEFDRAGFPEIQIQLASNLDEYKIQEMERQKIPANAYMVGTEYSTIADAPKLEIVYKIAELRNGRSVRPLAKLAQGKTSLPGRKQVFRKYDRHGKIQKDIIGLENEKLGKPLLIAMIKNGKLSYKLPALNQIRDYVKNQVSKLPIRLMNIKQEHIYPVSVSQRVIKLFNLVKKIHG